MDFLRKNYFLKPLGLFADSSKASNVLKTLFLDMLPNMAKCNFDLCFLLQPLITALENLPRKGYYSLMQGAMPFTYSPKKNLCLFLQVAFGLSLVQS